MGKPFVTFGFPGEYYKVTIIIRYIEVLPFVRLLESIFCKGHQGFFIVCSKVVLLIFRNRFLRIFDCQNLSFWC